MDKRVINRAVKKLELRDVTLHASSFTRSEDIDPSLYPISINKETSIQVKSEELSFQDEKEEEIAILRAYISFGVKGLSSENELFNINTIYRVDYEIIKDLTIEEMEEFSTYNAVHNAWSFWRQHIAYIVNNANLPRVIIPLFRDTGVNKKTKRKRRKAVGNKKVKRLAASV